MPTDLNGTPTSLGIGTYETSSDAPSGLGFNEAMAQIDALIAARMKITGTPTDGQVPSWDAGASEWVPTTVDTTPSLPTVNSQSGTTYTTVLGDAENMVEMTNASANTITIPPHSSVAYPVGTSITLVQAGAGQTTIAPGAGVTIHGNPGLKLTGQWAVAAVIQIASDTWVLAGNTSS